MVRRQEGNARAHIFQSVGSACKITSGGSVLNDSKIQRFLVVIPKYKWQLSRRIIAFSSLSSKSQTRLKLILTKRTGRWPLQCLWRDGDSSTQTLRGIAQSVSHHHPPFLMSRSEVGEAEMWLLPCWCSLVELTYDDSLHFASSAHRFILDLFLTLLFLLSPHSLRPHHFLLYLEILL